MNVVDPASFIHTLHGAVCLLPVYEVIESKTNDKRHNSGRTWVRVRWLHLVSPSSKHFLIC